MDAFIEELARTVWNGGPHLLRWDESPHPQTLAHEAQRINEDKARLRSQIRMAVSALASKGAAMLPRPQSLFGEAHAWAMSFATNKRGICDLLDGARAGYERGVFAAFACLSPIIAAKDIALAEAQARAERAESRLAAVLAISSADLASACLPHPPHALYGAHAEAILDLIRSRAMSDDPVLAAISSAPAATLSAEEQAELDRLAKEAQIGPGVSNDVVLFGLLKLAKEESDRRFEKLAEKNADLRNITAQRDDARKELAEERKAREADRAEITKLDVRWRQHYRDRVALMMFLRHPHMTIAEVVEEVRKQSLHTPLEAEELTRTLATAQELIEQRIASAIDAALGPIKVELDGARTLLEAERKTCEEAQALAVEATIALTEAREKIADLESKTSESLESLATLRKMHEFVKSERANERHAASARIAELEAQIRRLSCPICHGSGVLRGANEYELDTQCPNVGEHG